MIFIKIPKILQGLHFLPRKRSDVKGEFRNNSEQSIKEFEIKNPLLPIHYSHLKRISLAMPISFRRHNRIVLPVIELNYLSW